MEMAMGYDWTDFDDDGCHYYKLILLGDSGVGKSTFFHRIRTGELIGTTLRDRMKRPIDTYVHTTKRDGQTIRVILQDTCGEENYRTFTTQFYRKTHAVLLMFSVEDTTSLDNLHTWVSEAKKNINGSENVVWAVIGNKCDLHVYVEEKDVEAMAKQLHTPLKFYTSAKNGDRVQATFNAIIDEVHTQNLARPIVATNSKDGSIKLTDKPTSEYRHNSLTSSGAGCCT